LIQTVDACMRIISRILSIGIIPAIVLAPDGLASWKRIGTAPEATRALIINASERSAGFVANRKGQALFRLVGDTTHEIPLPSSPMYYAYVHDVAGNTLCTAHAKGGSNSLICVDPATKASREQSLPIPISSGAFLGPNVMWVVDGSDTPASASAPLVSLRRTDNEWEETGRRQSPLCENHRASVECYELEIHPLNSRTLAIVPLRGRFDGEAFRYPTLGIWDLQSGTLKRIPVPTLAVPATLRQQYRQLGGAPTRLIYRSAASAAGKIALIAVLPSDERSGVKRNELWLYDGDVTWKKIAAPSQINALTFFGEVPVIVTEEGRVYRWTP
jgi:hypothetical protein